MQSVDATNPGQQKPPPPPVFEKKDNATLAQRIEILDWYHANGRNQSKTMKHFDLIYPNLQLKQPRISAWVKQEAAWCAEHERSTALGCAAKRICQTQHPEVTTMLDLWVSKATADGVLLTGEIIRQKWQKFADLTGVPDDERLKLSEGWLSRYKVRTGLKEIKHHGEAGSVALAKVEDDQLRIQAIIKKGGYEHCDIFNTDETPSFYACVSLKTLISSNRDLDLNSLPPDRGLCNKQQSGVKGNKA